MSILPFILDLLPACSLATQKMDWKESLEMTHRYDCLGAILVCCLILGGCSPSGPDATKQETAGKEHATTSTRESSEGVSATSVGVPIQIDRIKGSAVLVNRREVRMYFDKSATQQNPNLCSSGTLEIAGVTAVPLSVYGSLPHADYIYARSRTDVQLPVKARLDVQFGSEIRGSAEFTLPETAALTVKSKKEPVITSAGLNKKIGDDMALLAVEGRNFTDGALFLRSGDTEVGVPVDVHTDTQMGLLDSSFEGIIQPGEWDVAVRTHEGEAVLPKGIVKK